MNWSRCSSATRPTIGRPASSSSGTAIPRRSTARTPDQRRFRRHGREGVEGQIRLPGRLPDRHRRRADDVDARRCPGRAGPTAARRDRRKDASAMDSARRQNGGSPDGGEADAADAAGGP